MRFLYERELMKTKISPFLMFTGRAEEALNFYISLFEDSHVISMRKYGPGEAGAEGTVMKAEFSLAGETILCIDSPPVHNFTFTPSMSLFVTCTSEAQLDKLFAELSAGGGVMMPLGNYGFSRKFAWVSDRFGVSWQINLP